MSRLVSITALLLLGCSADTGILVAVSGAPVDELEFQVAVYKGTHFLIDEAASGQRLPVSGRDLRSSPYELLVREEDPERGDPATVRVLALAYQSGAASAFALMEPPQMFIRGELLRRTLQLRAMVPAEGLNASRQGKGCYTVQEDGKSYPLVVDGDRDCDGFGPSDTPPDCDDTSALINPKAGELCDGKDNNCDKQFSTASELCYGRGLDGQCRQGTKTCAEASGGGLGPCVVEGGPEADAPYCFVYEGCVPPTQLSCVASRLMKINYGCTLERLDGVGSCPVERSLQPPFYAKKCRWTVASSGMPVTLLDASGVQGSGEQPTISTCSGKLLIEKGALAGGLITIYFYDDETKRAALIQFPVELKLVTACGSSPLTCVKK